MSSPETFETGDFYFLGIRDFSLHRLNNSDIQITKPEESKTETGIIGKSSTYTRHEFPESHFEF